MRFPVFAQAAALCFIAGGFVASTPAHAYLIKYHAPEFKLGGAGKALAGQRHTNHNLQAAERYATAQPLIEEITEANSVQSAAQRYSFIAEKTGDAADDLFASGSDRGNSWSESIRGGRAELFAALARGGDLFHTSSRGGTKRDSWPANAQGRNLNPGANTSASGTSASVTGKNSSSFMPANSSSPSANASAASPATAIDESGSQAIDKNPSPTEEWVAIWRSDNLQAQKPDDLNAPPSASPAAVLPESDALGLMALGMIALMFNRKRVHGKAA